MREFFKVDWSDDGGAEKFSSGVYFYKLIAGDYVGSMKMVFGKVTEGN